MLAAETEFPYGPSTGNGNKTNENVPARSDGIMGTFVLVAPHSNGDVVTFCTVKVNVCLYPKLLTIRLYLFDFGFYATNHLVSGLAGCRKFISRSESNRACTVSSNYGSRVCASDNGVFFVAKPLDVSGVSCKWCGCESNQYNYNNK